MSEQRQLTPTQKVWNTIAPAKESFVDEDTFRVEGRYAIQHMARNDFLMKTALNNQDSLLYAVGNCAAVGLTLNPSAHLAYLIPRKGAVYYEPSYMGMLKLATDSGTVIWGQADVVREGEEFIDHGFGEKPEHVKDPFSRSGSIRGAYCVVKLTNGDYLTTTMPVEELHSIRDRSESWKAFRDGKIKSGGPWETDEAEQMKKTCFRRGWKTWPRSNGAGADRLALAVDLSNKNADLPAIEETTPQIAVPADKIKTEFDGYIERGDNLEMAAMQWRFLQPVAPGEPSTAGLFANLYNSFKQGEKQKYKRLVDGMLEQGGAIMRDYLDKFGAAFSDGDVGALQELRSEISQTEWDYIAAGLPADVVAWVDREEGQEQ